eukprot:1236154-Amorphochlora_amoeboformis.AAC.3
MSVNVPINSPRNPRFFLRNANPHHAHHAHHALRPCHSTSQLYGILWDIVGLGGSNDPQSHSMALNDTQSHSMTLNDTQSHSMAHPIPLNPTQPP